MPQKKTNSIESKHVARLIEQNRLLAECLAEERKLRKDAYKWYSDRLNNKIQAFWDAILVSFERKLGIENNEYD